jgi:hypothetical protein
MTARSTRPPTSTRLQITAWSSTATHPAQPSGSSASVIRLNIPIGCAARWRPIAAIWRRDVEQHQARWPQSRMRCADRSQRLAPAGFGITRQAQLDLGIRRRAETDLRQYPLRVDLARGFDDPRQYQITKHVVALGSRLESQGPIRDAQGLPQRGHLRGQDLAGRICNHLCRMLSIISERRAHHACTPHSHPAALAR